MVSLKTTENIIIKRFKGLGDGDPVEDMTYGVSTYYYCKIF